MDGSCIHHLYYTCAFRHARTRAGARARDRSIDILAGICTLLLALVPPTQADRWWSIPEAWINMHVACTQQGSMGHWSIGWSIYGQKNLQQAMQAAALHASICLGVRLVGMAWYGMVRCKLKFFILLYITSGDVCGTGTFLFFLPSSNDVNYFPSKNNTRLFFFHKQ